MLIYVGSYPPGVGVSVYTGDDPSTLWPAPEPAAVPSASWLQPHPRLPVTYAVGELTEGQVHALVAEPGGMLGLLSTQPTGGADPCHLAVSDDCRYLLCANYGSGSVAAFPLGADGRIGPRSVLVRHTGDGPVADRQEGPHAHQVVVTGSEVVAVDLGTDELYGYAVDGLRPLWTAKAPAGAGPRHLVVHPSGLRFVADELGSTVSTFRPVPSGGLSLVDNCPATLVEPSGANYPAEIAVAPDGRHVYVSNRGNDTIVTFAFDGTRLIPVDEVTTGGHWPRHFTIVGDYLLVANERSDAVTMLRIDPDTGVPAPTRVRVEVPRPACVLAWD